ncbi:MAG: class I SAM-dependent methyltransferase [Anaerolineae bacterium]
MSTDKHQRFVDSYRANEARWDTGITPPEIDAILEELPPGKAIDLGCGTGTNMRTLVSHGWEADGVDFVEQAIEMARAKLADFSPDRYGLYCGDVSRLEDIPTLRAPYDLAIDIGCGHSVPVNRQALYAEGITARLKPGGVFMLYVHFPEPDHDHGWSPEDVYRLFLPSFDLVWEVRSDDTTNGSPSAWFRLARRP